MTVPHDPFSSTNARSWTDALPIPEDRYADALDAWLESHSATMRTGDTPSPAGPLARSQNGATDRANEAATATPPGLVASAERFHRRLETAERTTAPPVPEDAIWEKIMSTHLALEPTPGPHPPAALPGTRNTDTPPRPMRTIIGSHPALSILLAAALVVGMIALFRGISDHGNVAAPTDPAESGSTHLAVSATAIAEQCDTSTLSADEVATLRARRLSAPTPAYLPTQRPPSERDADAAITTAGSVLSCPQPSDQSADVTASRLWTGRYVAERSLEYPTDTRIVIEEQQLAASRELSPVLVEQDPTRYIVDANDPAIAPAILFSPITLGPGFKGYVLVPEDFVTLADGRIGAPLKMAFDGGTNGFTKDDYTTPQQVQFLIFANDGSQWLLDQSIPLCTWKCDVFFAGWQEKIDRDRQWIASRGDSSSPVPLATATLTASPVAADPWLQPITADECAPVMTSGESDTDAVATTARHFLACGRYGTLPDAMIPFLSPDFLARHPELATGQFRVTTAEVEDAKAISAILIAQGNYTPYVKGLPGAEDETDGTQGFYEVFQPESAIRLDDGRIGIPLKIAFGSDDALNAATQATDSGAPKTVAMYVFAPANGAWQVDQQLLLCVENCESFWDGQLAHAGTPYPSDEAAATAAASATIATTTAQQPCITLITDDDISQLIMESATWPDPAYVPTQGPATAADAQEAIAAYLANSSCRFLDDKPYGYQVKNLQTDRVTLTAARAHQTTRDYADMLAMS
ncbi:MAG TPA: hypothetical protein VNZ58_14310, partial [Thermomicrobiales bacterium]|nr:hypothetical protein [Thermomicrobiales bacterium]